MKPNDYSVSLIVDESPEAVFAAINDVRGWWTGNIEGRTDQLGAVFTYRYKDIHETTQKITEWVPAKKVVWHVLKAQINFVKDKTEWEGTDLVFEVARRGKQTELRFTHVGLVPTIECYGKCSGAWGFLITESLRGLITAGKEDQLAGKDSRRQAL
jgi:hypothetical protein